MKVDKESDVGLDESIAIKLSDLSFGDLIGSGGFGEVLIGTWSHTRVRKETVAIKRLLAKELSTTVLGEFKNEVAVHVELDHPNIVKLFGITIVQPYCMVMEFMSNGSLFSYLEKTPQTHMTWDLRLTIAEGIVAGMAYLHGINPPIIHGDLKSLNVLLDQNYTSKIADFGLSQLRLETASKAISNTSGQSGKGSLLWMAPELFERRAKKTLQSDVYALGWTLWELAAHKCPFYEDHDKGSDVIMGFIKNNEREKFPDGTPQGYQILIEACWDGAIVKRPTAVAALDAITVLIKPNLGNNVKPSAVAPKTPAYMTETATIPITSGSSFWVRNSGGKNAPQTASAAVSQFSPSYMAQTTGPVTAASSNVVKPTAPPRTVSNVKATTPDDLSNRYQKFNSAEEPSQPSQSSSSQGKILNQLLVSDSSPVGDTSGPIPPFVVKAMEKPKNRTEICYIEAEEFFMLGDFQRAIKTFEKAADMGYPPAYVMLARLYGEFRHLNEINDPKAWLQKLPALQKWLDKITNSVHWFNEQIDRGDPIANYSFGLACLSGYGVPQDGNLGTKCIAAAALKGYSVALYVVALSLKRDATTEAELVRAFSMALNAAEFGHSQAQSFVGYCYQNGEGVSQDKKEALRWYLKSADQKNGSGLYDLALAYETGSLDEKINLRKAFGLYEKSAEQGNPAALFRLACAYESAHLGLRTDNRKAADYYSKAIIHGSVDALRPYARCCEYGIGTHVNHLNAYKYYKLAVWKGDKQAASDLAKLKINLKKIFSDGVQGDNHGEFGKLCEAIDWTEFTYTSLSNDHKKMVLGIKGLIIQGVSVTIDSSLEQNYIKKLSLKDRIQFQALMDISKCLARARNKFSKTGDYKNSVFAWLFLKLSKSKNASELHKVVLNIFSSNEEGRDSIIQGLKSGVLTDMKFQIDGGNPVGIYEYINLLLDKSSLKQYQQSGHTMK